MMIRSGSLNLKVLDNPLAVNLDRGSWYVANWAIMMNYSITIYLTLIKILVKMGRIIGDGPHIYADYYI